VQAAQKSNGVRWPYNLVRVCWPFVLNSCGYQRRKSAEQAEVTAEKA
jgi:hypothetical protein